MAIELINTEGKKQNYVILIKAIDKFTSNNVIIGFSDNHLDADYIYRVIKAKTFAIKGDFVYGLELLPVYGEITDNLSIVYIGEMKSNYYTPICGFSTYEKAQEKATEIQKNSNYVCTLNYINKLDRKWADDFKRPPEYAWG